MSWSIQFIGTPEKVIEALGNHEKNMGEGASKEEFKAALPHITGILKLNFNNGNPVVRLTAHGSATTSGGEVVSSSCIVNLENMWGALV